MKPSNERKESWESIYSIPPSVKSPYNPVEALADIPGISHALDLFLASHMLESEDYCNKSDERKLGSIPFFLAYCLTKYLLRERLYFATGYGLIQCVKGLMSYEDDVRFLSLLSESNLTLFYRISSQESPISNMPTSSLTNIVKNKLSLVLVLQVMSSLPSIQVVLDSSRV